MMAAHFGSWFIGVGLVGTAAGLLAAAFLWLVLTQPLAVAQALAGGF